MILQSLCEYYGILAHKEDTPLPLSGYSRVRVAFVLEITPWGELVNVLDLRPQEDGRSAPMMLVPQQVIKSGIAPLPNFLCDNGKFCLGVGPGGAQRFGAFKEHNTRLLRDVEAPEARAVCAFLKRHRPETAGEIECVKNFMPDIVSGAAVFRLNTMTAYVHQNGAIRAKWEAHLAEKNQEAPRMQCLITGETLPICRLHQKIKGVRDGQSAGSPIVCFNSSAFYSYGKSSGDIAPVSQEAAFQYGSVLNYMLSEERYKTQVGDATTVFWASSDVETYVDLAGAVFGAPFAKKAGDGGRVQDAAAEEDIKGLLMAVLQGRDIRELKLDPDTRFYILGLSPNAGRVSVRFFFNTTFGDFIANIRRHYDDMRITGLPEQVPVWSILRETVSAKASEKKPSPVLSGGLMAAVLEGAPYPVTLYQSVLNRVRTEHERNSFNPIRAAIIKAFLVRQERLSPQNKYQEVLTVSLNESSESVPYRLGRLFAVLEKAQRDAIKNINATIKDKYFATAASAPAAVFPNLIRLAQNHFAKSEYRTNERLAGEILDGILFDGEKAFPKHLTFEEQGVFMLGYYHQNRALWAKKETAPDQTGQD